MIIVIVLNTFNWWRFQQNHAIDNCSVWQKHPALVGDKQNSSKSIPSLCYLISSYINCSISFFEESSTHLIVYSGILEVIIFMAFCFSFLNTLV